MKTDLFVTHGVIIPGHELEVTASRAGGPGGQHVNRTNSRVTVRWSVVRTAVLTDEQKDRVLQKLAGALTVEGDVLVHGSSFRSQEQNRQHALERLAQLVRKALVVAKKRIPTRATKTAQEARLRSKAVRSSLKRLRSKKLFKEDL